MKREEAIKLIDTHTVCFYNEIDSPTLQALHMAIEALSADADGEDLIIKGAKGIQDGLYNIKDGKLFKYKAKGGTVRTYPIVPSADAEQGYTEWLEKIIVDNEGANEWLCEDTPDLGWCEDRCHYSSIQAECLRHLYEVSKGGEEE